MRPVKITVTNLKTHNYAYITSYPKKPKRIKYKVPLYLVTVEGKKADNSTVIEDFQAIRFGVHKPFNDSAPRIVGLSDSQTHTLSWDPISTIQNEDAWRVYEGFFIHRGPRDLLKGDFGSIGCVEICGPGEWDRFNDTIRLLSGCKDLKKASNNRLITADYEACDRPKLIKVGK